MTSSDVPRTAQAIMDLLLFPNRSREWLRENIEGMLNRSLDGVYDTGYEAGYAAARKKIFELVAAIDAEFFTRPGSGSDSD